MATIEKTKQKKLIAASIILLMGNLLFFLTIWLLQTYDRIYFDQVLFQLKTSSAGVHHSLTSSAFVRVGVFGFVLTAVEIILYMLLAGSLQERLRNRWYASYCKTKVCCFFKKRVLPMAMAVLLLSASLFSVKLEVFAYVDTISTESDFIEEHYVDPETTIIKFPEEKRNLIYIFLESMETTFADVSADNSIRSDYTPELTILANENVSFSNSSDIGGALSYAGTTWTAAAMVAQTCGVPIKVPFTADAYGREDIFIPGVISIGEILEEQGYHQTLLLGSDAEFHGREAYFTQHGNYEILDTNALKAAGRLAENYSEWWGFEDQKLFAYAKEELSRLAGEGQPFNLTMLTADTHFPDGYWCSLCEDTLDSQYANVLSCSSKQVSEFVSWIKEQPFYDNTTIIISGDHLSMDAGFFEELDEGYVRTTYNCIINAPIIPAEEKNRQFATFDMFPTTLAALGVEIEGDRLGLGTNLFSDKKTLTEQYGFAALDEELQKKSEFYNTEFLGMHQ